MQPLPSKESPSIGGYRERAADYGVKMLKRSKEVVGHQRKTFISTSEKEVPGSQYLT